MRIFYWVMGVLIVGTFIPSLAFLLLYAATGQRTCLTRAQALWSFTRVLALFGFNLLVWGHVVVGLWHLWRP